MRDLFSASGRIGRLRYLAHSLLDIAFIVLILASAAFLGEFFGFYMDETMMVIVIAGIFVLGGILEIFATIKRFHDIGMSGWCILLTMVPLANIVVGILLLFKPGDAGSNRYGPKP